MNVNKFHFIYWFLFSVTALLLDFLNSGGINLVNLETDFNIIREFIVLIIEIFTFYSFLYALVKFDSNNPLSILKSLFLFIVALIFIIFLNFIRKVVAQYYGIIILKSWNELVIDSIEFYVQFAFYAVGYYYAMRFGEKKKELNASEYSKLKTENNNKLLLAENFQLQKNLLQSENNFLRAQINPHFLYNCLNFLYSKTFKEQSEVADAILLLSQIMRYSLTDFSGSNGLANLQEEVEHVENLIKINKFRFNNRLKISFIVTGEPAAKKITPMILMTLVENMFKHGNLQDSSCPASVNCTIDFSNKKIHFTTKNKKNLVQSQSGSGVGLKNIKLRLQLLYNDNFKFVVMEEEVTYTVELVLPYFD